MKKILSSMLFKSIFACLLLALMLMYQAGAFETNKIKAGYKGIPIKIPENVKIVKAKKTLIPRIYEESGIVSTKLKANISPQIMGTILNINVEEGQKVKKGDILALISSEQMGAKVEQVEKSLLQAKTAKKQAKQHLLATKASFLQAEKNYNRTKKYYKQDAASAVQLEDAESKYKQAKAMYRSSEQGVKMADTEIEKANKFLKEAKIGLSYSSIIAPFNGVVTKKFMDPGDMALPGRPIISLNNMNDLRIEANVRENLLTYLKKEQKLELFIGKRKFNGYVDEIVPRVDPLTRTFTVKVRFRTNENIFVGTYGKILIPAEKINIITAPLKSIKEVGQLNTVLVKENNKVYRRYIKLGNLKIKNNIEILSGLNGNEKLIVEGE